MDPDSETSTKPDAPVLLVDADSTGAVVLAGDEFIGYARTGNKAEISWRRPLASLQSYSQFICGAKCPSFVASGGPPGVPEPTPAVIGEARVPEDWLKETGGLNSIVSVDTAGSLRLVSDEPNAESWWQTQSSDRSRDRAAAGGSGLVLFPRIADRAAVVVRTTSADGTPTTSVFLRTERGWGIGLQSDKRVATCVSPDGGIAVVGRSITRGGVTHMIRTSIDFSSCWLTRSAVVLSQNLSSPSGPTTAVALVDHTGREIKTFNFDDEASVTTSFTADLFALSLASSREVQVFDSSGDRLVTLQGHTAGQFDELGGLCTLNPEGVPQWVESDRLSR